MKRVLISLLAGCFAIAHATPKYQDADGWRRDLRAAVDASGTAFLKPDQRPAHGRRLSDLSKRAEKLFGGSTNEPFGSCVKASEFYANAWQAQTGNLSKPSEATLIGQTRQAFEAGDHYGACRIAIDSLESAKK